MIEVRTARAAADRAAALALRERVFVEEQGVPRPADLDGRDGEATHLVAVEGDEVVGTCRLLFEAGTAKLGRLAVARRFRGRGVGAALLEQAREVAEAAGARRIVLHAQVHAVALYGAAGYEITGEPFMEAGIEHVAMQRTLPRAFHRTRA